MKSDSARREPEFLLIGRLLGTFGWAGEVKVRPETDFPGRFADLREVWLEFPDGSRRLLQIEVVRVGERQLRIKFAQYDSKEAAAALRNALILIPAAQAVTLPAGHFYLHQILGLAVRTTDGRDLGRVIEVMRTPTNDVYVTPQITLPALKEVVKEINLEQAIMVVDISKLEEAGT